MKPSFCIVGCGKVGTALGRYLSRAGYPAAGLASRSLSSARRAAEAVKGAPFSDRPWEVARDADVVFITTPDGRIGEALHDLVDRRGLKPGAVVLHASGALPSTILAEAREAGASIGSLHPLQSFASVELDTDPFQGIIMAVEGDEKAQSTALAMAGDLGARGLLIRTEAKTLYHAAAVAASNYLVALLDLAFQLLEKAGIAPADAWPVLQPLVSGTLGNIANIGIPAALTGPIARGDLGTVEQHLASIGDQAPHLLALYRSLGCHTVGLAEARGGVAPEALETLKEALCR